MATGNTTKSRIKDITGRRYGRLTVTGFHEMRGDESIWRCVCDCGTRRSVQRKSLTSGVTQSCGCLRLERTIKHGMYLSTEYAAWHSMMVRCKCKTGGKYLRYAARGIGVCERWRDFTNFYSDMGQRPSPAHTIDRVDNAKGYEPGNCRWATKKEQSRNTSANRIIEFRGQSKTLAEWSELLGVRRHIIYNRLSRGWPVDKAMTVAARAYGAHMS